MKNSDCSDYCLMLNSLTFFNIYFILSKAHFCFKNIKCGGLIFYELIYDFLFLRLDSSNNRFQYEQLQK